MKRVKEFFHSVRFMFVYPFVDKQNELINMDIERWGKELGIQGTYKKVLKELLSNYKEFRNLYIYRNSGRPVFRTLVKMLYKPLESLYITTPKIGGGLFIQHGFSTYIAAESIGKNCWINQQVSIGYKDNTRPPVIGDNVTITCGAKVMGPITIGDNVTIGANAVVVKDLPPDSVWGGVPAKRIR